MKPNKSLGILRLTILVCALIACHASQARSGTTRAVHPSDAISATEASANILDKIRNEATKQPSSVEIKPDDNARRFEDENMTAFKGPIAFLGRKRKTDETREHINTGESDGTGNRNRESPGVVRQQPLHVVVLGGPASGKGTQCKILAERLSLVHLSTGDMLREAVKRRTEEGVMAQAYMDRGELVPDHIVARILRARLQGDDCRTKGCILDGFPRTTAQVELLRDTGMAIDATVLLDVSEDLLIERIVGRRVDPDTGKIYHLKYMPPPADAVPRLQHRSDDRLEVVAPRIRQYNDNLKGILRELEDTVIRVDGSGDVGQVSRRIQKALRRVRSGTRWTDRAVRHHS